MTPNEAIDRLFGLLIDEREAIRSVDGARVEALAMEKASLLRMFNRDLLRGDAPLAARFRQVADELRNNAIILAHARNVLRDIVHAATLPPVTYQSNGALGPTAHGRVSVTG